VCHVQLWSTKQLCACHCITEGCIIFMNFVQLSCFSSWMVTVCIHILTKLIVILIATINKAMFVNIFVCFKTKFLLVLLDHVRTLFIIIGAFIQYIDVYIIINRYMSINHCSWTHPHLSNSMGCLQWHWSTAMYDFFMPAVEYCGCGNELP